MGNLTNITLYYAEGREICFSPRCLVSQFSTISLTERIRTGWLEGVGTGIELQKQGREMVSFRQNDQNTTKLSSQRCVISVLMFSTAIYMISALPRCLLSQTTNIHCSSHGRLERKRGCVGVSERSVKCICTQD